MKNLKGKNVFIVDDDNLSRQLLRAILRDTPLKLVGEATTGEMALEAMEKLQPDIVCLDIVMPGIGGIETLKVIREKYPRTITLMISGEPRGDVVAQAIANGAAGFVVKPFNAGRVLDALKHAVSKASTGATSA